MCDAAHANSTNVVQKNAMQLMCDATEMQHKDCVIQHICNAVHV